MDLYTPLAQIVNEAEWTHRSAAVYPALAREAALLREQAVQRLPASPPVTRQWGPRPVGARTVALAEDRSVPCQ